MNTDRPEMPSMRKAFLDALDDGKGEVATTTPPVLPLDGSLNVPITQEEEKNYE